MKKKIQRYLLASILASGALFSSPLMAADEPEPTAERGNACQTECKDAAAAAAMMNKLIGDGVAPEEAMVQTLERYDCAVEAAVAAALRAAQEAQYMAIIRRALELAGPGCRSAVMSGAVMAGVDPTPYMGIPGRGMKELPGVINRHYGAASPS